MTIPPGMADVGHTNIENANPNGQSTMANSSPVAIALDQSAIPTKVSAGTAAFIIKAVKNVAVTAGTGLSIWTPAAGKKFRLIGWDLAPVSASSQAGIQFQDTVAYNTANEFLRVPRFLSVNWTPTPRNIGPNGYLSTAANNQLWIDVSVTTNVEGYVYGIEE